MRNKEEKIMYLEKMGQTLALGAVIAFGAVQASAITIDFEDVAVGDGVNNIGGDVTSNGYLFDTLIDHSHLANNIFGADNGGTFLAIDHDHILGENSVTLSEATLGSTFNLGTIDFAEWGSIQHHADWVVVTGTYATGGTISQTVSLDGILDGTGGLADFQTETFNWTGLSQVHFEGVGPGSGDDNFAIDNLTITVNAPIPEPATLTLLGLGLVGMAVRRRRQA